MPAWTGMHASDYVPCGVPGDGGPCVMWNDHVGDVHVDGCGREWLDKVSPRRSVAAAFLPGDEPDVDDVWSADADS